MINSGPGWSLCAGERWSGSSIFAPELENEFEKADRTALYRTLKTFEEGKLIHTIDNGSGSVKYALCNETCECHPGGSACSLLLQKM